MLVLVAPNELLSRGIIRERQRIDSDQTLLQQRRKMLRAQGNLFDDNDRDRRQQRPEQHVVEAEGEVEDEDQQAPSPRRLPLF